MRVCIHRGTQQIGGSCVELESQGKRLLVDLGLPLDSADPTEELPTALTGLDGADPNLLGILISHPHLDHFGLLSQVSPKIPIGMGPAARRILNAAAPFMRDSWRVPANGWDYISEKPLKIAPFTITPYLVDHSAYDAYALLIESDGKRLFYSGDFRAHGRKGKLFDRLVANPPSPIDALLLEGSSIGRLNDDQSYPSEHDLEQALLDTFQQTDGLALVHTSSQNIDRVVTIMRASKRAGRRLVIDLYTAAILAATGNSAIPQSHWNDVALFIPDPQRVQIKEKELFELLNIHKKNRIYQETLQSDPASFTLLFRPLHQSHLAKANCLQGATFTYSQWEGYWERGSYESTANWLEKHHIPKKSIHTSGHAAPIDLKKLVHAMRPCAVIPIHSFESDRYHELFPNVRQVNDGEWWSI